jgi:hypothetical protein
MGRAQLSPEGMARLEGVYRNALDAVDGRELAKLRNAIEGFEKAGKRIGAQLRGQIRATDIDKVRAKLAGLSDDIKGRLDTAFERLQKKQSKTLGQIDAPDLMPTRLALDDALRQVGGVDDITDLDIGRLRSQIDESVGEILGASDTAIKGASKKAAANVPFNETEAILGRIHVPESVAEDLGRVTGLVTNPESLSKPMAIMRTIMSHWKASHLFPWPAYHMRNHFSGQVNNMLADQWDKSSYLDSLRVPAGKSATSLNRIPGWEKLSEEEATRQLKKLAFAHKIVDPRQMEYGEALGREAVPMVGERIFTPRGPGVGVGQRLNPLNIQEFAPYRFGADAAAVTEASNRLTGFISLMKKGWHPEEAAKRVKLVQVDYTGKASLDPTMQAVFPFWRFMRGSVAWPAKELFENPGGRLSQTIQTMGGAHDPSEMTPEHVAATASIPVGGPLEAIFNKPPEGTKRYFTGAGLMFEDPLSFLGGGVRGAVQELASRSNPLIKAPLEWATGQSFFQRGPSGGRPLEDMDPVLARIGANIKQGVTGEETDRVQPFIHPGFEHVIANMPWSRVATSLRTLTDTRKSIPVKAMQLGTGLRVTDVSPAAQDAMLQEAIDEAEKRLGGRTYKKTYVPKEVREQLPPQQLLEVLRMDALERLLRQRKKERKEAKD